MKSPQIADAIVDAAELSRDDTVLEVGPGKGILTERLVEKAGRVVAVELDEKLAESLKEKFGDALEVIKGDARFLNTEKLPRGYKLVSNLPYSTGTVILKNLVSSSNPPTLSVVTLQKEVAERITGDENSFLTVFFSLFTETERLFNIPPGCFSPPPKVVSTVIKLKRKDPPINREYIEGFLNFVGALFKMRRKKISSILKRMGIKKDLPYASMRPEELSLDDFLKLYSLTKEK